MVDQVVAVDLEIHQVVVVELQEDLEILLLNLRPQHPFKAFQEDLEQVTLLEVAAVVALEDVVATQVQHQETLEQVVLEDKIIFVVTTITGLVVVAVHLTVILLEPVELVVAVVVVLKLVALELVVEVQLMQVVLVEILLQHQMEQVVMVEIILVVAVVVLVTILLTLEMVDLEL